MSEIDSALNEWVGAVPEHCGCSVLDETNADLICRLVRWEPNREQSLFGDQSAILWTIYYITDRKSVV